MMTLFYMPTCITLHTEHVMTVGSAQLADIQISHGSGFTLFSCIAVNIGFLLIAGSVSCLTADT
jgi:hypothetical protein